jgi:Phosphodiester glycosidase
MNRLVTGSLIAVAAVLVLALGGLWLHFPYVLHAFLHGRGGYWIEVRRDDPRLSPSVRRALRDAPAASPGKLQWRMIRDGFEAGELAAVVDGSDVDRIFLARIDPAKFRFEVRSEASGDFNLDIWMNRLGAAAVINGSYYSRSGMPATPVLSAGSFLGPSAYDARAGAFVASAAFAGIRDLAGQSWQDAFKGARDAMVSYPLLVSGDGLSRVVASQWLANRSFIGQDRDGHIILGTTADGFFTLDGLASFLRQAPLGLKLALNLDGGPIACQGISLDGFERRVCGAWEIQASDVRVTKLVCHRSCERPAMPVALAVFPK